jgi:hypothetical protein
MTAARVATTLVVVLIALALVGYLQAMGEAERLGVGTGGPRDQEALELAREHWDNPVLRLLTLDRPIVAYGTENTDGCRSADVAAISFFGVTLDRVRVACDDSVMSLGT